MASRRLRSEFTGQDGPSGLPQKASQHLSASEKLRLVYTTGTESTMAPLSRRAWLGSGRYNPYIPPTRIPPLPPE